MKKFLKTEEKNTDDAPESPEPKADSTSPSGAPCDPFDPKSLRLDQSFAQGSARKLLTTVPVGKPGGQDFFRVHPHPDYRATPIAIIKLREENEVYVVTPEMVDALEREITRVTLFTTINRQGVLRLWPVTLPGPDGRQSDWHRSAFEAAERAMEKWIRLQANMSLGAYDIYEATGDLPEPEWPDLALNEILKIAFKGRLVDRVDHPLVERLRGAR